MNNKEIPDESLAMSPYLLSPAVTPLSAVLYVNAVGESYPRRMYAKLQQDT